MLEENVRKFSDIKEKTEGLKIEQSELQRDRALMNKLVEGRDLTKEEDIDHIYRLMLKYKGRMFCSPLGERFVDVIQSRTSIYRETEKKCKRLNRIAWICAGIAVLMLVLILTLCCGRV